MANSTVSPSLRLR
uniref:Uncharacterized protein n=1 Tax=Arundo donax TaxID=35708 RepID=A0A0A9H4T8_ARUDO